MRAHNSTIINKKKQLKCGHFDYNFSKGRCRQCATQQDSLKRIAEYEEQEQGDSFKNLVEDCDTWFSKYIRLLYADEKGMVECYTSGRKFHWTQIQCGHFISRYNFATRWLFDNCRPQSEHDNCVLNGNLKVFEKKLNEEKVGLADWLRDVSREVYKPTQDELKQMISDFRYKAKYLEKKIKR